MAAEDKWQGKASANVPGVAADKVWSILLDFPNIHQWIPNIDECSILSGEPGTVGCVRRTGGPAPPGHEGRSFANEEFVVVDPEQHTVSYKVTENSMGFKDFVATIKVVPEEDGSSIEWSFVSAPMLPFWSVEKIMGYISYSVQYMAQKIGEALKA